MINTENITGVVYYFSAAAYKSLGGACQGMTDDGQLVNYTFMAIDGEDEWFQTSRENWQRLFPDWKEVGRASDLKCVRVCGQPKNKSRWVEWGYDPNV